MPNVKKEKTLTIKDSTSLKKKISDVEIVGNADLFVLLAKVSSKSEGWMKSTKAMEIEKVGCVVQVTTQQGSNISDSVTFVPGCRITTTFEGNKILTPIK